MDDSIVTYENFCIYNGIKFYFSKGEHGYILEMAEVAEGEADVLVIPSTINDIPVTEIFYEEWKLVNFDKVIVSNNNSYFKTIDGVLFSGDMKTLLIYPPQKKDEKYSIPQTVEVVYQDAFSQNNYIKNIVFPNGIKKIYAYAFACCHKLETVYFPKTIEMISLKTFYFVDSIRDVFYEGTQQEWESINFAFGNSELTDANIHFTCEKQ